METDMETNAIWKKCLDVAAEHMSPQHFATWFKPIKLLGGTTTDLELEVPNRFFLEWIKEHYQPLIVEILRKNTSTDYRLKWAVVEDDATNGREARGAKKVSPRPKKAPARKTPSLNPKYTFENFVIGPANKFAHAASFAVSSQLASKYNPLFIYGDVGLGKTHLLQAIGHRAIEQSPDVTVCYYTSERFMNEFINYVSRQKMDDFRDKFRNVDLLLIDDIQFWAGKERTQEEFFHTFNTLYEGHKQIVVTSDKFPKDISGIEERLRSRFEWGLVADIQPLDTETKIAILEKKAAAEGYKNLPHGVAEYLAGVSSSNVRELEGYLTRVIAMSSLTGRDITLSAAKEALKNITREKVERAPSADEIFKAVCAHYKLKIADIKSKRRNRAVALPRQVAMYLARESGKLSYPEIGAACAKDHSTVIHAVKKLEKELAQNAELKRVVSLIKKDLGVS
jgi:chromosomal replication initiator protein